MSKRNEREKQVLNTNLAQELQSNNFVTKAYTLLDDVKIRNRTANDSQILKWGSTNLTPNFLKEAVSKSPIASRCLTEIKNEIFGEGFENNEVVKESYFPYCSMNQALQYIAMQLALYNCFALKIYTNESNSIFRLETIDVENLRRKKLGGGFIYNETYSMKSFNSSKNEYFDEYEKLSLTERVDKIKSNNDEYIAEIRLFQISHTNELQYPNPDWVSALQDIESDALISKFTNNNLREGLFPSAIINLVGSGTETERKDFENVISNLKSADNSGKVLLLSNQSKETFAEVEFVDNSATFDGFVKLSDILINRIPSAMGVPSVLIGESTPGQLGNNQELYNNMQMFSAKFKPYRNFIKESFELLLNTDVDSKNYAIKALKRVNAIPDIFLDVLTIDEKRELIGYKPITK